MNHQKLFDIMSGRNKGVSGYAGRFGLTCLAPAYRGVVGVRNAMFRAGFRKPQRLPKPVISIGNITTGGTGKTPMVIDMVQRLEAMGEKPAVLMRGYGEDEFVEIDQAVGHGRFPEQIDELGYDEAAKQSQVPVTANSDRFAGGTQTLEKRPNVSVFVLDDGFQHQQLARDLNLVLIDATQPFGFGRVLPRGLLREPLGELKRRASEVIITRSDRVSASVLKELDETIQKLIGKPPIAHVVHRWTGFHAARVHEPATKEMEELPALWDGDEVGLETLAGKRVLAVCAIGNPDAFFGAVADTVGNDGLVQRCAFSDHHDYTKQQVVDLFHQAQQSGAEALVMTEKDMVKWNKFIAPWSEVGENVFGQLENPVPIYRPKLSIGFLDGEAELDQAIQDVVIKRAGQ